MYAFDEIKKADSEIADAIQAEMERQKSRSWQRRRAADRENWLNFW